MKKEGICTVVIVLLLLASSAWADVEKVTLVDFRSDPYIPLTPDGPNCIGTQGDPLLPWIFCREQTNTAASPTNQCSGVTESAVLLTFHIDKPSAVRQGHIEVAGGEKIVCTLLDGIFTDAEIATALAQGKAVSDLNRASSSGTPATGPILTESGKCDAVASVTIPGSFFRVDNTLFCAVSFLPNDPQRAGMTLSRFSYDIEADFDEFTCLGESNPPTDKRARRWRQSLFDANIPACCGDDADESGRIETDPVTSKRSLLCYKDETAAPDDAFAWHNAAVDGGEAFIIKPVQFPGITADITSNKEEWFVCNNAQSAAVTLPVPQSLRASDQARAAKFACVETLDNFRWLECCDPLVQTGERACENALLPDRLAAAGSASTSLASFTADLRETLERPGDLLRIEKTPTSQSHPLLITNWNGFDKLHIIYKVRTHFDIVLQIFDETGALRFTDKLINYVGNAGAPRLDTFVEAQIPLSLLNVQNNLKKISRVDLRFDPLGDSAVPRSNILTVRAAYLVPNQGDVLHCTNARYSAGSLTSSWISDLDDASSGASQGTIAGEPAGKSACNGLGAFGWTGTQCCGNDGREFYADSEAGCWNGEAVAQSSTTMTVDYQTNQPNTFNCPLGACSYPASAEAISSQPLVYDVVAGKEKTVASRVPQQFVFNASNFFGCLQSDIFFLRPSNSLLPTVQDATLCSTKGGSTNFLCSPLDRGWVTVQSAKPLHVKTVIPGVNVLKNPRFDE